MDDGCLCRKRYCSTKLVTLTRVPFSEYYTFSSFSTFTFLPGKFYWELWDGNGLCKSVVTFEGNKMIHKQKGTRDITVTREFSESEMTMTICVDGLVAKVYHEHSFDFSGKKFVVLQPLEKSENYKS